MTLLLAPRRQERKADFLVSKFESFKFVSTFEFRARNLSIHSLAHFASLRESSKIDRG